MENTNERLTENLKKSSLQAGDQYDFNKLASAGDHFLPMEWNEEEETVIFQYDAKRLTPFTEVRKEERVTILNLLMQVSSFTADTAIYRFSLEPANLYYNTTGKICIKTRDLVTQENQWTDDEFLISYKALCACALTGQYRFKDYLEGGSDLMKKNALTASLPEITEVEALVDYLEQQKEAYIQRQQRKMVSVRRGSNRFFKISAAILLLATIGLGVYGGIQYFQRIPYLTAVTKADNAYIENDYGKVIEALQDVAVEDLEKHQKYILAKGYLQSESLTSEQKDNIQNKLTLASSEKELEYWISLGRLNVSQAENLAMQMSDDELLLYAYMKEKSQVESDTGMDGDKKSKRLQELQTKINSLAEQYEVDENTGVDKAATEETTPDAKK